MANWVVVGTGALSALWAHGLQSIGAEVTIYSRHAEDTGSVALGVTSGVNVGDAPGVTDGAGQALARQKQPAEPAPQVHQFPVIHEVNEAKPDAIWLIMVKAWQLQPLLEKLVQQGLSQATMILSHNGMGAGEAILAAQSDWQLYDLVTTHGAWRQQRTQSVLAGLGESWLGPRTPVPGEQAAAAQTAPPAWYVELAQALPPLHWQHDILHRRWQKMAINCAINPLATLAGEANGVLQGDTFQSQIRAVCEEISNVNPALDADELVQQVRQVAAATAANRCSMLQDINAGRRTEIAFLNGFICREGERLRVATRINCELAKQIAALEQS